MYTNVNLAAPIGVIAFLGTGLVLLVLGLTLFYSVVRKKFLLMRVSLLVIAVIVVAYLFAMLAFSVTSSNQMVLRGQEKHFCEVDCHLAYSIQDVRQAKTLGDTSASGTYYIVTIKTRFDENTISSTRGNFPLYPNSRVLTIIDADGRSHFPSPEGQQALEDSAGTGTPITTPLRPSESYSSVFVFDLPAGINSPVLLIREGAWITRLIIGHENSLAHQKTSFQI